MHIGVLALQGNFIDHIKALKQFKGVVATEIRYKNQIKQLDGLIIPGGESTTIGILIEKHGLTNQIKEFCQTKPVWGTCAGAILLSNKIQNLAQLGLDKHQQPIIGGLDVVMIRNYFGTQINSTVYEMKVNESGLQTKAFFIRAPIISQVSDIVKVLATLDNKITAVQQNNLLATVFHPELVSDLTWHAYYLRMIDQTVKIPQQLNFSESLWQVKVNFPRFLQGGVIMDVVNGQQAKIAESAGACCVMALERIPADIKADGGVARASDPVLIKDIQNSITIPVMAKTRIGHFGEAQIIEALKCDTIDESEVLTAADKVNHINKHQFTIPFVCGARNLGEALRRISEGAAMIRIKGDAGTGNVVNAVEHCRAIFGEIRRLKTLSEDELYVFAKEHQVPIDLVKVTKQLGRLPVITFAAGGIATPADVMLTMQLGCDGVFVGSGIFKSSDPEKRAKAIVDACTYFRDPVICAQASENLGKPMVGILKPGEEYSFVNPKL